MEIKNGIWPTMITFFTQDNKIDYDATERLIEWYLNKNVDGIFALCQSSEMFYLSDSEKLELIRFILEKVNGRVPVIASGHTDFEIENQKELLCEIAKSGIDALVLITNILAGWEPSAEQFKENVKWYLEILPKEVPLGMYECPYPFKYVLPTELLRWCADTGRFQFLKDTCCDIKQIEERLKVLKSTEMKLYNANTATLLESLRMGAAGYSGIMANIHPELYHWLYENLDGKDSDKIESVAGFLSVASLCECLDYPQCAKYYLNRELGGGETTRRPFEREFNDTDRSQMEHIRLLNDKFKDMLRVGM